MEKSEENWLQVSWTSDAGCFAVVTHRLYSAPRNKFSGFLHTLHSAEGRRKEHNSSDERQGQSWHWAYSAHFKGFACAFCHLYPAAPWLARGSMWEHGWQRKGLLTPQWPNRFLHKPTLLASLCLSWWHYMGFYNMYAPIRCVAYSALISNINMTSAAQPTKRALRELRRPLTVSLRIQFWEQKFQMCSNPWKPKAQTDCFCLRLDLYDVKIWEEISLTWSSQAQTLKK